MDKNPQNLVIPSRPLPIEEVPTPDEGSLNIHPAIKLLSPRASSSMWASFEFRLDELNVQPGLGNRKVRKRLRGARAYPHGGLNKPRGFCRFARLLVQAIWGDFLQTAGCGPELQCQNWGKGWKLYVRYPPALGHGAPTVPTAEPALAPEPIGVARLRKPFSGLQQHPDVTQHGINGFRSFYGKDMIKPRYIWFVGFVEYFDEEGEDVKVLWCADEKVGCPMEELEEGIDLERTRWESPHPPEGTARVGSIHERGRLVCLSLNAQTGPHMAVCRKFVLGLRRISIEELPIGQGQFYTTTSTPVDYLRNQLHSYHQLHAPRAKIKDPGISQGGSGFKRSSSRTGLGRSEPVTRDLKYTVVVFIGIIPDRLSARAVGSLVGSSVVLCLSYLTLWWTSFATTLRGKSWALYSCIVDGNDFTDIRGSPLRWRSANNRLLSVRPITTARLTVTIKDRSYDAILDGKISRIPRVAIISPPWMISGNRLNLVCSTVLSFGCRRLAMPPRKYQAQTIGPKIFKLQLVIIANTRVYIERSATN
ncbi:hypothetical protein BD779DRAFT_1476325 [Infundibulicybe gibba]|nr:hypothetical protein BD779DRAFT_1476325 [Infundibulicybe gibba]